MGLFKKSASSAAVVLLILSLAPVGVPLAKAGGLGYSVSLSNPWEGQSSNHTISWAADQTLNNLDKIILQYSSGSSGTQVPTGLLTTNATLNSLAVAGGNQTANWTPDTSQNGRVTLTAAAPVASIAGGAPLSVQLNNVINSQVTNNPSPCGLSYGGTVDNCSVAISMYDTAGSLLATSYSTYPVVAGSGPLSLQTTYPSLNGTVVKGTQPVEVQIQSLNPVTKVELYANNTLVDTTTAAPYTFYWDTSGLTNDSQYSIYTVAYDSLGNTAHSETVQVLAVTQPPSTSITGPTDNTAVSGIVPITAAASDAVGVAEVDFYIDNAYAGYSTTAPYTYNWDTSGLANGSQHILRSYAEDPYGNQSYSSPVTVYIGTVPPPPSSDTTPPTVRITSPTANASVGGTIQVSATASDNVGVSDVELSVDGASIGVITASPYTASWNTSGLAANTLHTLTATAYDAAGNSTSTSETVSIADTIAPSVYLTSPNNNQGVTGTVQLSADASDNVGVAKVEFYVGTSLISTATAAPYTANWDTSSLPQGSTQSIQAKAYDASGNVDISAPVSVTILDTTAPTVSLSNPQNQSTITGQVAITAAASDNIGLKEVQILVDGSVTATLTTAPYTYNWDTSTLTQGSSHSIEAQAIDTSGNATLSTPVTVAIADTTAPTIAITGPTASSTVSGTVNISYAASDNIGVTKVEYYIDGNMVGTGITAPYGYAWDTTNLANATVHTLSAKAYDAAGNISTTSQTVTVADITAPTLALISPTDGSAVSHDTTVTLQADATDISGIAKVEFYVNGTLLATNTTAPYSATWSVPKRKGQSYTITVKAYDSAGNISTQSATITSE